MVLLGVQLAQKGTLPIAAIAICLITTLIASLAAVALVQRGSSAHELPLLASSALAWGGGFLLAFAAAVHALRRDVADGVRAMFVARTASIRGYLFGRLAGLAVLLAVLVGGGTLLAGLAAAAAAPRIEAVPRILQATAAGFVFAVAFSVVVTVVAFSALGARSRLGGYLLLVAVVTIPELIVNGMGSMLPASIADVLSIPSALAALRTSLAPGTEDLQRGARAAFALAFVVAIAVLLVKREALAVARFEGSS